MIIAQVTRVQQGTREERRYPPVGDGYVMPEGYPTLRISFDMDALELLDDVKRVIIAAEASEDGGRGWRPLGSAEVNGRPSRRIPDGARPYFEVEAPRAGSLIRASVSVGDSETRIGLVVEAFEKTLRIGTGDGRVLR